MPTETDAALRREQRLLVTSTATAAGFAAVGIVWAGGHNRRSSCSTACTR